MDSNELKPCPWCSGADLKRVVDCGLFHILCIGCGAQGPTERLELAARAEWNRRPSVPTVGERELAEAVRELMEADAKRGLLGKHTRAAKVYEMACAILSSPAAPSDSERIYPCADCGVMRTKDEGGTTFTVCDKCWDKRHGKPAPSDPKAWVGIRRTLWLGEHRWTAAVIMPGRSLYGLTFDNFESAEREASGFSEALNLPLRVAPSVKADR